MTPRHGAARLTEDDVRAILATPRTRLACGELSSRFNISRTTVYDIWNGKIWRQLRDERGAA